MPTYSYRCTECGHGFDIQQSFSDSALTECPNCGGKLRKVYDSIGVTFNGSGFYRTDSRAKPGEGSSSGSGGSGSGDSGSKSGDSGSSSSPAPASTGSGSSGSSGSSTSGGTAA